VFYVPSNAFWPLEQSRVRAPLTNCWLIKALSIHLRVLTVLAGDGLYREPRHFTAWVKQREVEEYKMPSTIMKVTQQTTVPIGDFILETPDTSVTCETCEELVCDSFSSWCDTSTDTSNPS
jgi:hypothetical protein